MNRLFRIIADFFTYEVVEVETKKVVDIVEDENYFGVWDFVSSTRLIVQPSRYVSWCSVNAVTKEIAPHLPELGSISVVEISNKISNIADRTIEDLEDMKLPIVDIERGEKTIIICFLPYTDDTIEINYID